MTCRLTAHSSAAARTPAVALCLALALALAALAGPINAQSAAPAASLTQGQEDADDNGRYQLFQGSVSAGPGATEQRLTLMIDTQAGRLWMLTTGSDGVALARVPLKNVTKLPDNMSLRPGPLAPIMPAR